MDRLTLFGLFAVTAMLVCYALEDRSRWFVLGFAVACALGSVYGFLQRGLALRGGGSHLVPGCGAALVVEERPHACAETQMSGLRGFLLASFRAAL